MSSKKTAIAATVLIVGLIATFLTVYRYPSVTTTKKTITTTIVTETQNTLTKILTVTSTVTKTTELTKMGSVSGKTSEDLAEAFIIGSLGKDSVAYIKVKASDPVLVLVTDTGHAIFWDLLGVYQEKYVLASDIGSDVKIEFRPITEGNYSVVIGKLSGYHSATYIAQVTIITTGSIVEKVTSTYITETSVTIVQTIITNSTYTTERGLLF